MKEKMVKVIPIKSFKIVHNQYDIDFVEGVECEVPEKFIENLMTEGVIKFKKKKREDNQWHSAKTE